MGNTYTYNNKIKSKLLVMKLFIPTVFLLNNEVFSKIAHSNEKSDALAMLRVKRGNEGVFEEIKAGHMERECIEESCSKHEFDEVLDLDELSGVELAKKSRNGAEQWKKLTNRCSFRPCSSTNTKTCKNEWNSFKCICKQGWTGTTCEEDVDECSESGFCKNNGICTNNDGGFNCECQKGWTGDNCEIDVDECLEDPCQNGGSCTNIDGSFFCDCATGWTGNTCGEDINECEVSDPCTQENQYCINEVGSFKCACKGGWSGNNCDEDLDECAVLKPCRHGATCATPEFNSFTCSCPDIGCNNYVEVEEVDEEEAVTSENVTDNVFVSTDASATGGTAGSDYGTDADEYDYGK